MSRPKRPRSRYIAFAATVAAAACFGFSSAPAFGALAHNEVEKTFTAPCKPIDLAAHEASEVIYISCVISGEGGQILKLNYEGEPINFTGSASYIEGNALVGSQLNPLGHFGFQPHLAVDNSGGPSDGTLYVAMGGSTHQVEAYRPNGEFSGFIGKRAAGYTTSVAVDKFGHPFVQTSTWQPQTGRFNTSGTSEEERLYPGEITPIGFSGGSYQTVRADSTGAAWIIGEGGLRKYELDQFKDKFPRSAFAQVGPSEAKLLEGSPSPYVPQPFIGGVPRSISVDPTTNNLYARYNTEIRVYSEGNTLEDSYDTAPSIGGLSVPSGTPAPTVVATADHRVFTTTEGDNIIRYGPGDVVPDIHTNPINVDSVTHDGGTVTATVALDGGSNVTECSLQYEPGFTAEVPCTPGSFSQDEEVSAAVSGLTTGDKTPYRFKATNEDGSNVGIVRNLTPAFVLKLKTLAPSTIDQHSATLVGSFEPDLETTYYFEYGVDTSYGLKTSPEIEGVSGEAQTVNANLENLPSGKQFHYRIVASNENGTTRGQDIVFRTASAPTISGAAASELGPTSATLNAKIDPVGYATKYRFEYGTTVEYGQATEWTALPGEAGSTDVQETLTGLLENQTYHFRVVAENQWGTSESADTTFDFAPPTCPNAYVRQQTGSSYLPDCRAYELVSPPRSGAVLLVPSDEYWEQTQIGIGPTDYGDFNMWAQNTGLASSPPRFAFASVTGTIDGLNAPNNVLPDTYVSTRSPTGWTTTLPGFDDKYSHATRKQCKDQLDLCIEGTWDEFGFGPEHGNAPFMFTLNGKMVDRLPTNAGVIPNGYYYTGGRRISRDFSHFVFSSKDVKFTPDGSLGNPGSAYVNELTHRTVELISLLPGGEPIPQNGSSTHAIEFPGISADGTHVLMQTEANRPGPFRLYMRVNSAISYELAPEEKTVKEFIGMTRDGSRVFFTSDDQLIAEDTDAGTDVYMWKEGEGLTVVSRGNGNGNSDDCSSSWIAQCGATGLSTERKWAAIRVTTPSSPPYYNAKGLDDLVAEEAGDVYFFSPEILDETKFGVKNQRNLYVYRNGSVQLVATLDPGTDVQRMQISRDGSHAAFLSDSQLTTYNNDGFREMYTYDAEARKLECASCPPSGVPAVADAKGSQGGPFMADDGRTFFATSDDLIPRDRDGLTDVYEYVDGRPQLISSGTSSRDFTGGSELFNFVIIPVYTGLESVSRDGTDVFFSTYDPLVDQDQNGQFVKFYDARSGGGFPTGAATSPCEAADECHGVDSAAPILPAVTSTSALKGGNVKQGSTKKKGKRKQKARKRRKARRQRHRRRGRKHRHKRKARVGRHRVRRTHG